MNKSSILPLLLLSALLFVGCEDAKDDFSSSWNNLKDKVSGETNENGKSSNNASSNTAANNTKGPTKRDAGTRDQGSATDDASAVADAVPFSALRWSYGRFKGSGAKASGVQIAGLRMSKDSLSFTYRKNLSAWGFSSGQTDAVACLFVQKSDGSWVGGKFDWISSSRSSRDLKNVRGGYEGWNLSGVPNPCSVAFVIVHKDGKKRSNVISGRWSR